MSANPDAAEGRTHVRPSVERALWRAAGPWWLFLLTGLAWLIIALVTLRFTTTSIVTVGVLLGVLFLLAAFNEFMISAVKMSWRWAHILLGIFFVVGAIWAFARPVNAFWSIASVLGFLLILRGTFDIISAVATKDINSAWWLGMLVGILEIFLGFWASSSGSRSKVRCCWSGSGFSPCSAASPRSWSPSSCAAPSAPSLDAPGAGALNRDGSRPSRDHHLQKRRLGSLGTTPRQRQELDLNPKAGISP